MRECRERSSELAAMLMREPGGEERGVRRRRGREERMTKWMRSVTLYCYTTKVQGGVL